MKQFFRLGKILQSIPGIFTGLLLASTTVQADIGHMAAAELAHRIEKGTAPLILDVRTEKEFNQSHVPGAVNISHEKLSQRLGELPRDKSAEIVVYCRSGHRAGIAENILQSRGYTNIIDLTGHMSGWLANSYPIAKKE